MLNRGIGVVLLLAVFLSSCGSKRRAAKSVEMPVTTEVDHSIKSFEMSNLTFHTFSGRAKAKVQLDNHTHDATVHIRIDRDKAVWMSVTSLFNIEVARVLITPDSVKVLTKFPRRELVEKPFSYIYHYVNTGVSFRTLQDILIGNVSMDLLRSDEVQVATSDEDVIIIGARDALSFQYGMNALKRPFAAMIEDRQAQQHIEVSYGQYGTTEGHVFPQQCVLTVVSDGLLIKADLMYNRLVFNDGVEMPF